MIQFNEQERELINECDRLRKQADQLFAEAVRLRNERAAKIPPLERLTFARSTRCHCGLGMAYDPHGILGVKEPFKVMSQWECSGILLGTADKNLEHTPPYPFAFYEIKSETPEETTRPGV